MCTIRGEPALRAEENGRGLKQRRFDILGGRGRKMHRVYHNLRTQVHKLCRKYRDCDLIFTIPLALLTLNKILRHICWRLNSGQGLPQAPDSQWYMDYTTCYWKNLTDGLDINDTLYFGYNSLLTLLMAVFDDPVAVVVVQAIAAGLSVILVYKIARILFNRTTAILACLFYYQTWDITLWSLYILSDSFFVSLLLLCVYCLLLAMRDGKYLPLFAATALYTLIFRPTGIIAIGVILVYIAIQPGRGRVLAFMRRHRAAIGGSIAVAAAAFGMLAAAGAFDPFLHSLQFNAKMVLYNVYAKGWIYDRPTPYDYFFRPDYRINIGGSLVLSFIVNNWDHVSVLYAKRGLAFLGKWVWEINLATYPGIVIFAEKTLPVLLFATGTFAAIANGTFRRAAIVWLVVLAVFAFCVLLFIDAMYRYRLPAVPFIAIIAAYGADRLLAGAFPAAKKITGMLLWKTEKS